MEGSGVGCGGGAQARISHAKETIGRAGPKDLSGRKWGGVGWGWGRRKGAPPQGDDWASGAEGCGPLHNIVLFCIDADNCMRRPSVVAPKPTPSSAARRRSNWLLNSASSEPARQPSPSASHPPLQPPNHPQVKQMASDATKGGGAGVEGMAAGVSKAAGAAGEKLSDAAQQYVWLVSGCLGVCLQGVVQ